MIIETLDSVGRNVPVSGLSGLPVKQANLVANERGMAYIGGAALVLAGGVPATDRAVLAITNPGASGKTFQLCRLRIWSTVEQQFQFFVSPTTINAPTARAKRQLNAAPGVVSVATLQSALTALTLGTGVQWENEVRCFANNVAEEDFGDEFCMFLAAGASFVVQGTSGAAQTTSYELIWMEM